ncbi:metallophosphoesterase family protein [Metabacillus sp. 84]|uniref:metallophosphoesterase family protein n=1 Tax=unclassified Metabacillus TaxID=2675274 RepID=UPI003CEFDEE2
MNLFVISDTHIPKRAKALPDHVKAQAKSADAIIHAGDFLNLDAYYDLCRYGPPVYAVYGNADDKELKEVLPSRLILNLNGFALGVVHGHEGKGATTEKRALNAFGNEKLDSLIFGHSHIPISKQQDGVLLFNPGSPTDKRRQALFSYGIIRLEEEIYAKHVFFKP